MRTETSPYCATHCAGHHHDHRQPASSPPEEQGHTSALSTDSVTQTAAPTSSGKLGPKKQRKPFIDVVNDHPFLRFTQGTSGILVVAMVPMMIYQVAETASKSFSTKASTTLLV